MAHRDPTYQQYFDLPNGRKVSLTRMRTSAHALTGGEGDDVPSSPCPSSAVQLRDRDEAAVTVSSATDTGLITVSEAAALEQKVTIVSLHTGINRDLDHPR